MLTFIINDCHIFLVGIITKALQTKLLTASIEVPSAKTGLCTGRFELFTPERRG